MFLSLVLSAGCVWANETTDIAQVERILSLTDIDHAEMLRLLEAFKSKENDTSHQRVRIVTLRALISLYEDGGSNTDRLNEAVAALQSLAEKMQDKDSLDFSEIMNCIQDIDRGQPEGALSRLNLLQQQLSEKSSTETKMYLNVALGKAQFSLGNFEQALKYDLEALHQTDLLTYRQTQNRISRLDAIARLYVYMKDPEKALSLIKQAFSIASLANTPRAYISLNQSEGMALSDLHKHQDALIAYQQALTMAKEMRIPLLELASLIDISDQYLRQNDYKNAEIYARQSLVKAKELNDLPSLNVAKANLGFALAGTGKVSQGAELISSVVATLITSDQKTDAESLLGEQADMYEKAGMYKDALMTLRRQQKLSSELFLSSRAKAVATVQEQFEARQRQKQIELLAKENDLKDAEIRNHRLQQIVTLLAALVMIMIGGFMYLLYRRVQKVNLQLREANFQLEFHATRDPLTGLYNRRSFLDMMKGRPSTDFAERRLSDENHPDGLILLDIDHFKHINDTLGHAAGDAVLVEVAQRLANVIRDTDKVLRWGGEEFLVFSPKSNPEQIANLVERVLFAVGEQTIKAGEKQIQVTMTAGFITLPFSGIEESTFNWEKVLQIADMALYLGKANGRNRAYGISKIVKPAADVLPVLEQDLAAAIAANMVELVEVNGPPKFEASILRAPA